MPTFFHRCTLDRRTHARAQMARVITTAAAAAAVGVCICIYSGREVFSMRKGRIFERWVMVVGRVAKVRCAILRIGVCYVGYRKD